MKYKIEFQWRNPDGMPRGPHSDPRSWRTYASWPICFDSADEAWAHLKSCGDPFRGLRNTGLRKLSVTVAPINTRGKCNEPKRYRLGT